MRCGTNYLAKFEFLDWELKGEEEKEENNHRKMSSDRYGISYTYPSSTDSISIATHLPVVVCSFSSSPPFSLERCSSKKAKGNYYVVSNSNGIAVQVNTHRFTE